MILQVEHIGKQFAGRQVLDDVTFSVDAGAIVGLLGANGAGKTTLLRIVTTLLEADCGQVLFCGHPLSPADLPMIGYMPEERGLYRRMAAGQQAVWMARLKGMTRTDAEASVRAWFDSLGIADCWRRPAGRLSKGTQQKLQFAVTVAHNPRLLILDEPFTGLDEEGSATLTAQLRRLAADGTAILLSTHNLQAAATLCGTTVRL